LIILTNGFAKKTQKTPSQQIDLAEQRKRDYLNRKESEENDE
jgi:phage-related protein